MLNVQQCTKTGPLDEEEPTAARAGEGHVDFTPLNHQPFGRGIWPLSRPAVRSDSVSKSPPSDRGIWPLSRPAVRSEGVIQKPAIVNTGEGHGDAMQKGIPLSKPKWPTLLRTVSFRPGPNDSNRSSATAAPANTYSSRHQLNARTYALLWVNKVKFEVKLVMYAILLFRPKWNSANRNFRDLNLRGDEIPGE